MKHRRARVLILGILYLLYLALAVHMADAFLNKPNHFFGADFSIYHQAYLEAVEGGNPYRPLEVGVSYINHPALLSLVGITHGIGGGEGAKWVWFILSVSSCLVVLHLMTRILLRPGPESAGTSGPEPSRRGIRWTLALVFLAFAPVWETLITGQVNAIVLLVLVASLVLDLEDRPGWAGVSLALAIVLKTSPAALAFYFLVLGRWRVLASAAISIVVLSGISALQFGGQILPQWLEIQPELGRIIRNSKANQSILALAYRQLEPLGWEGLRGILLLLHKLSFVGLSGYVLGWSWRLRADRARAGTWLFAAFLSLIVVFSPLLWLHHSLFLVLPLALLLFHRDAKTRGLAVTCILLIQLTRVFELQVTSHAWTALLAHGLLVWRMLRELPRLAGPGPGSAAPPHRS